MIAVGVARDLQRARAKATIQDRDRIDHRGSHRRKEQPYGERHQSNPQNSHGEITADDIGETRHRRFRSLCALHQF